MKTSHILDGTLTKYKQAWIITWEWTGDHAKVENEVVAILDWRYSYRTIKRFVEWVYTSNRFAFYEQLAYAKNRSYNPYRVQFGAIEVKEQAGSSFSAQCIDTMIYGSNPFIRARLVYDVQAYVDKDNKEHLKWRERTNKVIENGKLKFDWEEYEIVK